MTEFALSRRRVVQTALLSATGAGVVGTARGASSGDHQAPPPDAVDISDPAVEYVEAAPDDGFHFPYFLYDPAADSSTDSWDGAAGTRPLFVELSSWSGGDVDRRVESGRKTIQRGLLRRAGAGVGSPALVAALPAWYEDVLASLGPQGLAATEAPYERVDRQLLAMVADARERLDGAPYSVAERVHLHGFSANGRFVDMFAALHPDRVNAVSTGGNGVALLPVTDLAEEMPTVGDPEPGPLPWPVGVADLEAVAGTTFDADAWHRIEQFRYIGADDQWDPDEHSHPREYRHALQYGHLGEDLQARLIEIFGWKQVDERFATSRALYDHLDAAATFRAYEGVGHMTSRAMAEDIVAFHQEAVRETFGVAEPAGADSTAEGDGGGDGPTTGTGSGFGVAAALAALLGAGAASRRSDEG